MESNNKENTGKTGYANPPKHSRFKPGQSGNPKGRAKKLPEIDKLLADVLGSLQDDKSPAHDILNALLRKARKGDVRAAEILLDRGYGKAKQVVHATGNIHLTDEPIVFE